MLIDSQGYIYPSMLSALEAYRLTSFVKGVTLLPRGAGFGIVYSLDEGGPLCHEPLESLYFERGVALPRGPRALWGKLS
jgi:hypothetical protein